MDSDTYVPVVLDGVAYTIRPIDLERDRIGDLTTLLHRAYARLAAMGLRYRATHQDDATTLERIATGTCLVALRGGELVGTITWYACDHTSGSPWYDRPDVGQFAQFGIEPDEQGKGLGGAMLGIVEQQAAQTPMRELALDTSEQAAHLIAFYQRRGYRFVEYTKWEQVNYRSVIMSKPLR